MARQAKATRLPANRENPQRDRPCLEAAFRFERALVRGDRVRLLEIHESDDAATYKHAWRARVGDVLRVEEAYPSARRGYWRGSFIVVESTNDLRLGNCHYFTAIRVESLGRRRRVR